MEEDSESPPTSLFFSKRAQFFPQKTAEELQAAAELVNKIHAENSKTLDVESAVPTKKKKTKGKQKKLIPTADVEDNSDDLDDVHSVSLSASARRRLEKLHKEQELERDLIEAENRRILSAMDTSLLTENVTEIDEDFEKITVLDIFPKVAELFNLRVTDFLLCLGEKNIIVDDTPKSLKITNADILECIPYKADENSKTETEDNGNVFKIFFQSNDSKQKIDMSVHKVENMHDIMKRYSEQRNIPLDQLIFDFDGERLTGDETPAELDMESESCIDVTVLVPPSKVAKKRRGKS